LSLAIVALVAVAMLACSLSGSPAEEGTAEAARGTDGRTWPWGDTFEDLRANLSGEADGYGFTAPVGSFPDDVSPYGLLDVAGNAAEWASDWWGEAPEEGVAGG
jgi:formylglycine-generating enzyme required for sulfatase activity